MSLGNRLYDLRKKKNISQEEAAEKLGVTRQTISKWETDQSLPEFDKILPLCELYEITTEELLTGNKLEKNETIEKECNKESRKKKTAFVVSGSVFLYFIAVIWIILMEPVEFINENIMISIFMLICAIPTAWLVFYFISIAKEEKEEKKGKEHEKYDGLIALIFTCIYFLVSFFTSAWQITWIIWIIYALIIEIIHLLLEIKENKNERK